MELAAPERVAPVDLERVGRVALAQVAPELAAPVLAVPEQVFLARVDRVDPELARVDREAAPAPDVSEPSPSAARR